MCAELLSLLFVIVVDTRVSSWPVIALIDDGPVCHIVGALQVPAEQRLSLEGGPVAERVQFEEQASVLAQVDTEERIRNVASGQI